jgi:iron complex outermembrane recepter protein
MVRFHFLAALRIIVFACCLPSLAGAAAVAFDLPAQSGDAALLAFSRQAKVEVLFSFDELRALQTPEVIGRFEPEDALARLLANTGYSAARNGRGKFVVTRTVPKTGTLKGRLLMPDGAPAVGIKVGITSLRGRAATDREGDFAFTGLRPGVYDLAATDRSSLSWQISGVAVQPDQVSQLEPLKPHVAGETAQLAPLIVKGKLARRETLLGGQSPTLPRTATGNLDLERTEDDALPYTIYRRDQLTRSGVVNLNEFLQRELLDADATIRPPEQNGSEDSFLAASTNLRLRGYDADETVVLINGRRMPEGLFNETGSVRRLPPDVGLVPLSLVQQIEVLPVSASALYSGNPVGGVINILLRPDANLTEVTATYLNATAGFDAPQSSVSIFHGQTFLNNRVRVRLNATSTRTLPATENELGYHRARGTLEPPVGGPVHRATPNVRSIDGSGLFGPGTPAFTSVRPGASGGEGIAAFAGREGLRNLEFFDSPGGMATSLDSGDYPYGRRQSRDVYFGSVVATLFPWLELGLDLTHARTVVNRGYEVVRADLTMSPASPLNPFPQDIAVSLNETVPLLGEDYSEARLNFTSAVLGAVLTLPAEWRVSVDAQYGHNLAKYRGLAGVDYVRWQQLVDRGRYQPLRDTQVAGPPAEFYDDVLIYRGGRGRFVTLGDYQTFDLALRGTNTALRFPTGPGRLNLGGDYRRNQLQPYREQLLFGDGSPAAQPLVWTGRTLQRYSAFGEMQAPLVPVSWLPSWLRQVEANLAARYVAADTEQETNVAPTFGLKVDFSGGVSLRGSVTTSNRFPSPYMSRRENTPTGGGGPGVEQTFVTDPLRNGEGYGVVVTEAINPGLQPESAVTQTAGTIFQRGQDHRLRASIDFVDTRKTDELVFLDAPLVMNLEQVLPGRVQRFPAGPDESVGRVSSLLTGITNLGWRHSQNLTTSLSYAWAECRGGTLELYGRLLYFQRYERQILPTSPITDELRSPVAGGAGLLKYRANFGASWNNDNFGFGLDGRYFHARVLPVVERLAQGDDHIDAYWQFDAYVQSELHRWLPWKKFATRHALRAQLRVNNVLAADFPRYANEASGAGVQPYGDWRGRVYSLSLTASF